MEKTSLLYSIPYQALFSLYFILAVISFLDKNKRYENGIRTICFFSFLFFFGLRGYIAFDCHSYSEFFNRELSFENFNESRFEPGFVLYMMLCKAIVPDYHFFVFLSTLIDLLVFNWFFKRYSPNYALSFAIFLVFSINLEIELARNVKAILLFLVAIPYIEKRKPLQYFSLITLALTFHLSSVFYYPLYFFIHKKISRSVVLCVIIFSNLIYLSQIQYLKIIMLKFTQLFNTPFNNLITYYLYSNEYSMSRGISIGYIERTISLFLVYMYYNKLISIKSSNILFINLYLVYNIITLCFSEFSIFVTRVGMLFTISYCIIWPSILYSMKIRNNIYCLLLFFATYSLLKVNTYASRAVYLYENILFNYMSKEKRQYIIDNFNDE